MRYFVPFTFSLLIMGVLFVVFRHFFLSSEVTFGATYSSMYAQKLGINPYEGYLAMLDDLKVKNVRLPLYWNEIEAVKGEYDWSRYDFFMDEAKRRGVKVTLVVGNKVPRFPECHTPDWAEGTLSEAEFANSLLAYMDSAVRRYKDHEALVRWQVENEPFFPFGVCPKANVGLLKQEVDLVRRLDPHHPLQLTVSGEQEAWINLAAPADVLGVSLYRFALNDSVGLVSFPHSPLWYVGGRMLVAPWTDTVIISELQAEPWLDNGRVPEDIQTAYELFPVERLEEHVRFSRSTHFPEVYVWGVEWWYYLHKLGESRLWKGGQRLFDAQ